ncbi:MAG: nuclear transport factor 2 family protein [Cyclobacteriaceae bacterium]
MKKIIILLICGALGACNQLKEVPPIELVDPHYVDLSKGILTSLCKGDIDSFIEPYTENAIYRWNYGDSLVGRQAIIDYWKARRTSVIDTITFKNESWLAIRANNPPAHLKPGVYVLSWADFTITYTNGSTIDMNIHTVFGYDSNDKVAITIQYLDRSLIENALKPTEK